MNDSFKPVLYNHDMAQMPIGKVQLSEEIIKKLASGQRFEVGMGFTVKKVKELTNPNDSADEPMETGRIVEKIQMHELSLIPIPGVEGLGEQK